MNFSYSIVCRLCGSNNRKTILKFGSMPLTAEPVALGSEISSGQLTVCICNGCGYVFLREVIDTSMYSAYLYTPQSSEDVLTYLKMFVADTVNKLGLEKGYCGLEIGSGDGALCREFNKAGITFTGVEPSKALCYISTTYNAVYTINSFINKEVAKSIGCTCDLSLIHI